MGLDVLSHNGRKERMVQEMLSIVKLGSVIFVLLVLNTYNRAWQSRFELEEYFFFMTKIVPFLAIVLLYSLWVFVLTKKTNDKLLKKIEIVESLLFVALFIILIVFTGANESNNKIVFLFIIITTTIQSGMRFGMLISAISAASLLAIDLWYSSGGPVNLYFEEDVALIVLFFSVAWALGYYVKVNREHVEKLVSLIDSDGLTELYNHRRFYVELSQRFAQHKQSGTDLALVLLDLDYFKQYNDFFGHLEGDKVLRQVGGVLKPLETESIIPARYGGDEFGIIISGMDRCQVYKFSEELRKTFEAMSIAGEELLSSKKMTVSIGIAFCTAQIESGKELMKYADDALYKAKFNNRNRVEFYTSVLESIKGDIEREQWYLIPTIKILVSIINTKDKYTYGHMEKVVLYAKLMAEELKLDKHNKRRLILGAYVHDVGKININEQILIKETPLKPSEWEVIKQHPIDGAKIIQPISRLNEAAEIVLHHHERFDGSGYPDGLVGTQIPYLARIMTVIDCYDAMTTDRPYTEKLTIEQAVAELRLGSGAQFDPEIVEIFVCLIERYPHFFNNPLAQDHGVDGFLSTNGRIDDTPIEDGSIGSPPAEAENP